MFKRLVQSIFVLGLLGLSLASTTSFAGDTWYHPSGKVAWHGSRGDTIYHSNGNVAWYGRKGDTVYYSNGKVAWYGRKGDTVYHYNGRVAWYGRNKDTCYYADGTVQIESCGGITNLYLGEGLYLSVGTEVAIISLYGGQFRLDI